MGFYGHFLIGLALVFFKFGGRRFLRKGLPKDKESVPSVKVSPPSPADPPAEPEDEVNPKDLRWVKHALDNPSYQDGGEGVHPDGGMMDEWMQQPETPGLEKSEWLKQKTK